MGCCLSSFFAETHPEKHHHRQTLSSGGSDAAGSGEVPSFSEFTFSDLKAATNSFSSDNIVSESSDKAPNIVYKGCLQNRRWIPVKKFSKAAWPEPKQFVEEAWGVGELRHKRLTNLIGYCCDGDERLLVAEYKAPNILSAIGKRLKYGLQISDFLQDLSVDGK